MSELSKRPLGIVWLFLGFLFLFLFGTWINVYGERVQIEQKRLELTQDADLRDICQLALDAYRDAHYFPFADGDRRVEWTMPNDCVGVIR